MKANYRELQEERSAVAEVLYDLQVEMPHKSVTGFTPEAILAHLAANPEAQARKDLARILQKTDRIARRMILSALEALTEYYPPWAIRTGFGFVLSPQKRENIRKMREREADEREKDRIIRNVITDEIALEGLFAAFQGAEQFTGDRPCFAIRLSMTERGLAMSKAFRDRVETRAETASGGGMAHGCAERFLVEAAQKWVLRLLECTRTSLEVKS